MPCGLRRPKLENATTKVKHRLSGELEADGHGIRKLYVSPRNQHFSAEIEDATTRYRKANPDKKLPSYWQAHLRVVGVKKRMAKSGYRSGQGVRRKQEGTPG